MAYFTYQASNYKGEVFSGSFEAETEDEVVLHLQSEDLIPVRIKKSSRMAFNLGFKKNKVKAKLISIFTMELATLLEAGLPLDRSLNILINMEEDITWKRVLEGLLEKVKSGVSLSEAMAAQNGVFSQFYVSMVAAGEVSGALNSVLARLAEHQERSLELRSSIRKALVYPVILVVVGTAILLFLLFSVVPQFQELVIKNDVQLPLLSSLIFATSDFLRSYWFIFVGIVIVLIMWVRTWFKDKKKRDRLDEKLLNSPLFGGLIKKIELARSTRTLGTMLTHGVPLVVALKSVKNTVSNHVLAGVMDKAMLSLKGGRGMAKVLIESKQFPSLGVQMIKVGEETGQLEKMLMKVADIYDKESEESISGLLAVLQPVIVLFIAGLVFLIMLGVILAIMSLSNF